MYLVYVDDSAENDLQVLAAVIVKDNAFAAIETSLALTIEEHVPEELREKFEFHTSDLINRNKPFQDLKEDVLIKLLNESVGAIVTHADAIVYGAVNVSELKKGRYGSAVPADVAFRLCLEGVEEWFASKAMAGFGLVIADDTENKQIKSAMQKAYNTYRSPLRIDTYERTVLKHLHDDMYFGSSATSVGIQLADVATYFIRRRLAGNYDYGQFYEAMRNKIQPPKTAP